MVEELKYKKVESLESKVVVSIVVSIDCFFQMIGFLTDFLIYILMAQWMDTLMVQMIDFLMDTLMVQMIDFLMDTLMVQMIDFLMDIVMVQMIDFLMDNLITVTMEHQMVFQLVY